MAAGLGELVHMRVVLSERFLVLVFFGLLVFMSFMYMVHRLMDVLNVLHMFVKMFRLSVQIVKMHFVEMMRMEDMFVVMMFVDDLLLLMMLVDDLLGPVLVGLKVLNGVGGFLDVGMAVIFLDDGGGM